MPRYDLAIIGTGPAGLSAAITARVRNKNFLLFGNGETSEKVEKAHTVSNYLGLPGISGEDMKKAFLDHVKSMDIRINKEKVTLVFPMGDYFSIQTSTNTIYEATAIILAAGMSAGKTLPGEEEYLGRGVSYCATCDAGLYRGKTVAVIGFSAKEEAEADFLTEYAEKVFYFPMYKQAVSVNDKVKVINDRPVRVEGGMKVNKLVTESGEYELDGVFILRDSIAPSQLIYGLEMDGNHVRTNRDLSTSVPGCFAAGDITGLPYQYIKAAGEGNVAALSAVKYIDQQKKAQETDA